MIKLRDELETLLKKYPDPRKRGDGIIQHMARLSAEEALPKLGIVCDNKDPELLGRVRVSCDPIAPAAVTGWIPLVTPWSTVSTGWWQIPDIGTQVLLAFPRGSSNDPVVLGCLYDEKHVPPERTAENPAQETILQTKTHRLEILDEEGKESITLYTAEGKMRLILSSEKGIELTNELGDITIECKNLTIESEKDTSIQATKKLTITGEDAITTKSNKTTKITNDKEVTLKGKNIKLEGSKGIATGGKQLAKQGDKVVGFDIHKMRVPSGDSTKVVPLPHPFIGKMNDKLSKDVKIAGKNAATKGSMAKHDSGNHMQLPGTIRFENGCKKTGEVTNGTAPKVKINGKEAATIGSQLTTCNDMGQKNNSTIIAVGASVPMPTIINPNNTEEYEKKRKEKETKTPEFTTVKWSKTKAKEGEELELSAAVKDIDDGNMVTLQIFRDGEDPAVHVALKQIPAKVDGGKAVGKWTYATSGKEIPPDSDPAFFFSAHSAWCAMKKSGNATVELKRPELSSLEWKDKEGSTTSKGLVGEALTMSASCNDDMDDGAGVVFRIYPERATPGSDRPLAELGATNDGGKAEAEWIYYYKHDPENPLTEKPKFFFTATAARAKEQKSGDVEVGMAIEVPVVDSRGNVLIDLDYVIELPDGSTIEDTVTSEGFIKQEDLIPGKYLIELKLQEKK